MTALTADISRSRKILPTALNVVPAKGDKIFYGGSILCRNSSGLGVPGTDTAGLRVLGIVTQPMNTTGLADGSYGYGDALLRCVQYDQTGEWAIAITGSDVPKVDGLAFLVDDNTVTADAPGVGATSVNGIIVGRFTRPAQAPNTWFVNILYRGVEQ